MDSLLIIFVLAVIAVSLGYWWFRQKGIKAESKDIENQTGIINEE